MLISRNLKRILNYLRYPTIGNVNCYSNLLVGNYLIKKKALLQVFQLGSQISTTAVVSKIHTTKGWKAIAVTGQKLKVKDSHSDISAACEEGRGAVLHSDLISELQKCDSILSQIEKFCSLMSLTDEEKQRRTLFCKSLEEMLKTYFPNFKLHQFGSSVNDLGFKGCDMDVCLQTLFNDEDYVMLKDVPTLDSVINGTVSQETLTHMNPMYMLRFVRRILRRHGEDIKEPILFIKARCPILRFYNAKYDVFCDFSCESEASLRNTRLLRFICQLDERFKVLAKIIRYWGKYGGFVGDIDMFNSYAFSLFVLHFLQNTNPPVLPPVKEMLEKSNYLKNADVSDVAVMIEDLKNFQPSENSETIDKLLRDFYFYYMNFDFERVLLPFTSSSVHKTNFVSADNPEQNFPFGTVSIQDPFRHSFNATGVVTYKYGIKFLRGLVQACETYQDSTNWIPGNKMWGLCSLFKPPVNDYNLMKQWQQNREHQIKLMHKPKAALKLRNILEYGLLFQCKEFRLNNTDKDSSDVILKLQCKGYSNTWTGRDVVLQKDLKSNYEPLEVEHLISKEIVKSQNECKRELLCEFHCVVTENESFLVLNLDFKGIKYPYVLVIFLKEFIPSVFNKL